MSQGTLEHHEFALAPPAPGTRFPAATDERSAREELRRQIGELEARLGELWASAFPRRGIDWRVGAVGGPRVLGVADLERVRDALVVRIREAQLEIARRADVEERNRGLLERMVADPAEHRWLLVRNDDLGGRECLNWHSRPRWGILGMLFGWWRVKLSSGCPLATGRAEARPAHQEP
jgi:hypothetical protein